ncbi:hypothetical protein ACFQS1_20280 [Paractinoplanes rhizophilus]|jgi:transcriptional regulator with XRE-family HTH domain|uniref:HTH cro/C1-type domain-containing protein n=1 Tax=Paractinoplanes rhizophilus TaxID=1416877 RepID=A0ABW2HTB3_9ACTN|nr:helix-turn-helix domain-containing protein [Actinoplanes sp.]
MNADFSRIFRGLMQNRRLSARAVSRASGRAESTVNQLLAGTLPPNHDILRDFAPVLQLDAADLFVIANLPIDTETAAREPYPATAEIGQLVAAASFLNPAEVKQLIQAAKALRAETPREV